MYELIILSLLMQGNAHGYLILKIMSDISGPYTKFSNGRLYPLLSRLEEDGLITTRDETVDEQEGGRHVRTYQITEEGRQRFHELMLNTISNPSEYQKLFLHKVQGMIALSPSERLYLLDHYINFCQSHILHLTKKLEFVAREEDSMLPSRIDVMLSVMQHTVDQWRLELEWANELREKEIAQGD